MNVCLRSADMIYVLQVHGKGSALINLNDGDETRMQLESTEAAIVF
jgi:hypothetical protein